MKEANLVSEDEKLYQFIFILAILIVIAIIFLLLEFWKYHAALKVGPVTRTSVVVFPGHKFTVDVSPEGVRFLCDYNTYDDPRELNSPELTKKLEALLKIAGYSFVYKEARAIMIKMNGFVYGRNCHLFEPVGGATLLSYYTYQMYGDNRIQVTRYVEDGVSYLAGFCIYIHNESSLAISYRESVVKEIMESAKLKYKPRAERRAENSYATNWDVTPTGLENGEHTCHECVECSKDDQPPAYTSLFIE